MVVTWNIKFDVAKKVIELTESKSKVIFKKPLTFMSPLPLPDITLAKERLSWFPIALLEEGINGAIEYFRAYKYNLRPTSKLKQSLDKELG